MHTLIRCFLFICALPLCGDDSYAIPHALVSIYAVDSDTGKVLISKNAELCMTPASCMKLVTTGAALEILGPDHKFETQLEYDGVIKDGLLTGNIYIRGGGDPTLGSDRIQGTPSWNAQISVWAEAVQGLGIERIQGKIIGDENLWEKARAVPSWAYEDLANYYGAGASALSFHENYYTLYFKPGKAVGEEAAILRTEPEIAALVLKNEVKTGPIGSGDQACIYGSEISPVHCVRGTIPLQAGEFAIKGAIPNSVHLVEDLLSQELKKRGVVIEENASEPQKRTPFHTTVSKPLKEIVYFTNQKSINLYAEHLLKKMGKGTTESGIKAVTSFWKSQGLDLSGFNMADGSGLSRKNLITTKQLVEILLTMKKSKHFDDFFASLPQKSWKLRAKSGTMSLIKGCAGYSGNVVFAILINQCKDSKAMNEKIELILDRL